MRTTIKRMKESLARFRSDESGNAALLIAPMMIAIGGMAVFAVDGMHAFTKKEQMRTAAEAGAMAAIFEISNQTTARQLAMDFGNLNTPADSW